MGIAMMLWAIVSALTAVSKNFTGLLLTRFFLGVTEAPYYPGAVYLLSIFYTRKEVATRIAILYTGNILATAFAGLIAAGIFHGLDDAAGISGWRWLFRYASPGTNTKHIFKKLPYPLQRTFTNYRVVSKIFSMLHMFN